MDIVKAAEIVEKIAQNLRHLPDEELLSEREAMADELDSIDFQRIEERIERLLQAE